MIKFQNPLKWDKFSHLWQRSDQVVVVAPGPSLSAEQIDLIRNSDAVSITVGDAGRAMFPDADILYHCDRKYWEHYNGCPEFQGVRVSLEDTEFPNVYQVKESDQKVGIVTNFPEIVIGNNSGHQAISLAIHFHPKEIILVGYDMKHKDKQESCIGRHPEGVRRPHQFPMFIYSINQLVKPLYDMGIAVYNCTIDSDLHCFPKKGLADVLRTKS